MTQIHDEVDVVLEFCGANADKGSVFSACKQDAQSTSQLRLYYIGVPHTPTLPPILPAEAAGATLRGAHG